MKQKLKRIDLINLYKKFDCSVWKTKIKKYLEKSALEIDSFEIEIEEQDIKYAISNGNSTQKEALEDAGLNLGNNIKREIKTIEDILKKLDKKRSDIVPWKTPKNKAQKSQNAFALIQAITEVYNEGYKFNWNNSNEYKYYPWFRKDAHGGWALGSVYCYFAGAGHGFGSYFKSEELARDAANKFIDIYIDYLPE